MYTEWMACMYHSPEWMLLVELGWITSHVDADGLAHMMRERRRL